MPGVPGNLHTFANRRAKSHRSRRRSQDVRNQSLRMCGIAGIVGPDSAGLTRALANASAAIVHRGPDDAGNHVFQFGSGHAGFSFRRLAILDLTPAGHQPMVHPETGDAIVFNGEIYNFAALRRDLESRGIAFRGHSDSEVLLHALVTWGDAALSKLEGMYALAFHDCRSNRILLARDPLGIKPLYVSQHGGRLAFASEVRAILATGLVPDDLDPAGVASLLAYGAPQDPFTVHRHIRSFPAGSYAWITTSDVAVSPRRFWSFPVIRPCEATAAAGEPQVVRELLDTAVRDHLVSDVPIGVFLSAGLDSTVLAALAARHAGTVRTFTVGYDEPGVADELAGAALVARSIGSKHEEIVLSRERIAELWKAWMAAADRPSVDGFNTFIICRAVKEAGLTVALSGLGSDELFGGYGSFMTAEGYFRVARRLRLLPPPLRRLAVGFAARLLPARAREKAVDMFCDSATLADAALQVRRGLSNRQMAALGLPATAVGLPPDYLDSAALAEAADGPEASIDPFALVSRLETRMYMGNTLLRDTDVNSMASSLEVRVPFLAQPLVNHVAALPREIRAPQGSAPKHLLRAACGDLIPPALLARPKTGFTLPIDRWMRGPMRDDCTAAVEAAAGCGLLDPAGVRRIWDTFLGSRSSMQWSRAMTLVTLGKYLHNRDR